MSLSEFFPDAYLDLRRMARNQFQRGHADHTLQSTELVHETFIRLVETGAVFPNRAYFFGAAAQTMLRILLDHVKRRGAGKRFGGQQRVNFEDVELSCLEDPIRVLALEQVLERLEAFDARLCRVVELIVFAGCTTQEVADLLDMGESTVRSHWTIAKKWLSRELKNTIQ